MRKILIVDDELVLADTLVIIFANAGHEARAASSAEQALELIADWCPDLAIIDVVLPKMNGIDLANPPKANRPNCRIVLFSGKSVTAEANASGHTFEIVVKPVHPSVLLSLVSQLGF